MALIYIINRGEVYDLPFMLCIHIHICSIINYIAINICSIIYYIAISYRYIVNRNTRNVLCMFMNLFNWIILYNSMLMNELCIIFVY